jgi:methyl-accepting chemotaxis protein
MVGRAPSEMDGDTLLADRVTFEALVEESLMALDAQIAEATDDAEKQRLQALRAEFVAFGESAAKIYDSAALFAQEEALAELNGPLAEVRQRLENTIGEMQANARGAASSEVRKLSEQAGNVQMFTIIGVIVLCVIVGGAGFFGARSISQPVRRITSVMGELATGNTGVDIPGAQRGDEIGEMAAAVEVFRQNMIETDRLRAEQEEAERRSAEEKRAAMMALADRFDASVGEVVSEVANAATRMQSTAQEMSGSTDQTDSQATAVAAATEQAATNVQTVASATEELDSSINEISQQVGNAASITRRAVSEADKTNETVRSLAEAAQKIGDVVELINSIASQTNLLALNATIEAARAGDAGKGFAVVASEVKNLANQTAQATEEISSQIAGMQGVTGETVQAIEGIGKTISEVNEIAGSIAAAVEEQGAATREIARNVQEAARGTQEVSSNIGGVQQAASVSGQSARDVLEAAQAMSQHSQVLREQVESFLGEIRAA